MILLIFRTARDDRPSSLRPEKSSRAGSRYDVPIFATPEMPWDLHGEVARGLYSVPMELVGQRAQVWPDSRLVKVLHRRQLVSQPGA
jgi:hypothetical protein